MRALLYLLAYLPLPVLQALGKFAGWLLWVTGSSRKRVALLNLRRCMPELSEAERVRIARASLAHEFMTYVESPRLWIGPANGVKAQCREYRNVEALDRAYARGKGLLLLTLHMGAFEAAAIPMSGIYHVGKWYAMYKPQGGLIDELSTRGRCRFGGRPLAAQFGVRKAMLPALAQNEGLYYMPDHDPPPGSGVFAPFFGQQAHTPTLIPRVLRESGCAVVFMFGERLPNARGYVAHFIDAPDDLYQDDVLGSATAMNRCLEQMVRACPEQYWWGYKRFRRQPEGQPEFYAELKKR
ncbi:MAG TPA: lysophospholipid acyltransferase family protein [Nevskiaceae bacterium]|nr:lysophospholipid acyltransferase family protein [Nevskiaceae bacterium]